jgi:hypothetical protein
MVNKQVFIIRTFDAERKFYMFVEDKAGTMLFDTREAAEAHLAAFQATGLARFWNHSRFSEAEVSPYLVETVEDKAN